MRLHDTILGHSLSPGTFGTHSHLVLTLTWYFWYSLSPGTFGTHSHLVLLKGLTFGTHSLWYLLTFGTHSHLVLLKGRA